MAVEGQGVRRTQRRACSHLFSYVRFGFPLSLLLVLAACSTAAGSQGSSPTRLAHNTPARASCDARFGGAYQATLPDATFHETTVYAQVPLPPQTRSYDDDASGLRGRFLCSAGTTESVLAFMPQHLTQLGWQLVTTVAECGETVIPHYGHPQCWKHGTYRLFLGINSNADWVMAFIDPAFLP